MNRRLLDPFQSVQLPEAIEEYLDHGTTTCIALNRRGTLLAAGTAQGDVVFWDFDTRGVARVCKGHSHEVTGVSWSRNGHYLVSGGKDCKIVLWEVLSGTKAAEISDLPAPVTHVVLTAQPPYRCLVSLAEGPPLLIDLEQNQQQTIPLIADSDVSSSKAKSEGGSQGPAVAVFNKACDLILVGQAKGMITVLDAQTLRFLDVVKLPTSNRVLGFSLNRQGNLLLANCQDRVIRMYDLLSKASLDSSGWDESEVKAELDKAKSNASKSGSLLWTGTSKGLLQPIREFQNVIDRMLWRSVTFSSDSEHVIAAAHSKTQHHMYIWNRVHGNMERILEGPKEGILDIVWHPLRSILLSISGTGVVYLWAQLYAENWSAFAPDFNELDENNEYVEREDEFDWQTPAATAVDSSTQQADDEEEAGDVDILTLEEEKVFDSDTEEELAGQLHHLPVVIQADEEPAQTQPGLDPSAQGDQDIPLKSEATEVMGPDGGEASVTVRDENGMEVDDAEGGDRGDTAGSEQDGMDEDSAGGPGGAQGRKRKVKFMGDFVKVPSLKGSRRGR